MERTATARAHGGKTEATAGLAQLMQRGPAAVAQRQRLRSLFGPAVLLSDSAARGEAAPVVQRQLVEDDPQEAPGHFTDTRDTAHQTPLVFQRSPHDANLYREMYSGRLYRHYPAQDQFADVAPLGAYLDPVSHQSMIWLAQHHCYACPALQQYYVYDGAYYQPLQPLQPQQPQQQLPQPLPQPQVVHAQAPIPAAAGPRASGGGMSNDDFRRLVNSGGVGSSIGRNASEQTTLKGALATLRSEAQASPEALEQVLNLLAYASHARGVKGLTARIEDVKSFTESDRGHDWAAYTTYLLFVELLGRYRGQKLQEFTILAATCKGYRFDQPPPKDDGHGGPGGGQQRSGAPGLRGTQKAKVVF